MTKEELQGRLETIPLNGHPNFYRCLIQMAEIYSAKNSDYSCGNPLGNFKECEKAGIDPLDGLITRLGDKYSRICSLNKKRKEGKGPAVKDEKMADTFLDTAVYSVIANILMDELSAIITVTSTDCSPLKVILVK